MRHSSLPKGEVLEALAECLQRPVPVEPVDAVDGRAALLADACSAAEVAEAEAFLQQNK